MISFSIMLLKSMIFKPKNIKIIKLNLLIALTINITHHIRLRIILLTCRQGNTINFNYLNNCDHKKIIIKNLSTFQCLEKTLISASIILAIWDHHLAIQRDLSRTSFLMILNNTFCNKRNKIL